LDEIQMRRWFVRLGNSNEVDSPRRHEEHEDF
jgi:hypothetical protein